MSRQTVRFSTLGVAVGPGGSTGFHFQTGFNDTYTGANSGYNLVSYLERVQSVTDGFSVDRTNVNQLGQLAYVSQEIINQPTVPVTVNWISADLSNELKIGLYVSGDQGALTNILNGTQNNRNIFVAVAPEGQDQVGWTGQSQVFQLTNAFFGSYSTQASVGGLATASATFQGLNYATSTGSLNQSLNAVNQTNGQLIAGINYSLPVMTTGLSGAVSALRYGDITLDLSGVQGLLTTDLKIQSYNISFDTNLQNLLALGTKFAYAKVPQFPINLNCNVTANYGDLVTGSLSNLLCNDNPFNLTVKLFQPGCGGYGPLATQYRMLGMKLVSQEFGAQEVGSNTATVSLTYLGQLGGPFDQRVNLIMSGQAAFY